jgi:hypothetical protein
LKKEVKLISNIVFIQFNENIKRWLQDSKFILTLSFFFLIPFIQNVVSIIRLPEIKQNIIDRAQYSKNVEYSIFNQILKIIFQDYNLLILLSITSIIFLFLSSKIAEDLALHKFEIAIGIERKLIFFIRTLSLFSIGITIELFYISYFVFNIFFPYFFISELNLNSSVLINNYILCVGTILIASILFSLLIIPLVSIPALLFQSSIESFLLAFSLIIFGQLTIPVYSQENRISTILILNIGTSYYYFIGSMFSNVLKQYDMPLLYIGSVPIKESVSLFFLLIFLIFAIILWLLNFFLYIKKDL